MIADYSNSKFSFSVNKTTDELVRLIRIKREMFYGNF